MHRSIRPVRAVAGFTLVELMVALVLGLLVLGSVITVYMNNTQAAQFQTGVMRAQENGRFAIDVLSRTLRMAGYDPDGGATVSGNVISGTTGSSGTTFTQSGLKSGADTITVRYEGGTDIRDCRGVATSSSNAIVNQYAILTDASGIDQLVCNTADGNAESLAEGIEDMQVLYGVDLDSDGVANRYVDASSVSDWGRCRASRWPCSSTPWCPPWPTTVPCASAAAHLRALRTDSCASSSRPP